MKIFVFQDIHSNIDVLCNIEHLDDYKNADYRIFLGDLIGLGPDAKECVDKLMTMDTINLMGNHDYWIANHLGKRELNKCEVEKIHHVQYFRNTLDDKEIDFLNSFKRDYSIEIEDKKLYFTHFIWESEEDTIHCHDRSNEAIFDLFKDNDAKYIFYGHEHDPSVNEKDGKYLICFGSTGIIYPGYYGVIEIDNGSIILSQKTINYDLKKIQSRIAELEYPLYKKFMGFYEYEPFVIDINEKLKNVK